MKVLDLIFCDDVRNEIGNKLSLCGIYQQKIYVAPNASWPILFPKFCIVAKIQTDGETSIKGNLLVKRDQEPEKSLSSFECSCEGERNSFMLPFVLNLFSFVKEGKLSFCIESVSNGKKERFEFPDYLWICPSPAQNPLLEK